MAKKSAALSAVVALVAAVAVAGWVAAAPQAARADTGQTMINNSNSSGAATPAPDPGLPKVPDMSIGNPDAKVTVIEYGSFTCPHCREWHSTEWPKIKKNYIDTGKVRFTFREVYFDKYGLWAGMMAHCGGPMRYFGIVDILYDTQDQWAASSNPNQVVANIRKIGKTAGMTDQQLNQCMNDGKMAQALVAKYQETTAKDHIEGTPSFVIDGTTYKNMSYDHMASILDAELAKKK